MSESKTENDQIDFAGRWESDERLFEDGCRFVKSLEQVRAWHGGIPDSEHADKLIKHFCAKVRRSPDTLLGRLAHGHKLDNAGIVTVALVLLGYLSSHGNLNMFYIGTLVAGLSIPELARFRKHLENGTGFMRLLEKYEPNLFPKPEIIQMDSGNDHCWTRLREEIAALPVKEQRDD